jgi:hypothetical protein
VSQNIGKGIFINFYSPLNMYSAIPSAISRTSKPHFKVTLGKFARRLALLAILVAITPHAV